MPKIQLKRGDYFISHGSIGVVIADGVAVLVKGKGGRLGYDIKRGGIPTDAQPINPRGSINFEVRMALRGALAASE